MVIPTCVFCLNPRVLALRAYNIYYYYCTMYIRVNDIAHHVPSGLRENRPWCAGPMPPMGQAVVERQGPISPGTLGVPASTLFGYYFGY